MPQIHHLAIGYPAIPQKTTVLKQLATMQTFFIVWFGQLISLTGSSMTGFALGIWVFQRTGSATSFALTLLFTMLPRTIVSPFAGVLADRFDRRWIMILSGVGAGVSTVVVAALLFSGEIRIWHIYLATAFNAGFGALQVPAFGAAVTRLVPKMHYGRANGLMELSSGIGQVIAPVLAGVLIGIIRLEGVLLINMVTFLFAVLTLLVIRFPQSKAATKPAPGRSSWLADMYAGWRYLVTRTGLMGLVMIFALVNLFIGIAEAVLTPMILSFTSADTLGAIMSTGGVGMLIGGLFISVWGGGKRKVYAVFVAYALLGLGVLLAGVSPSVGLVTAALFFVFLCLPTVMGASQAIMQAKVTPAIQGRVFSLRMMVNTLSFAIAFLIGGPLADKVFEPLLAADGLLANNVGQLIGTGPGRGMGLMFIVMGFLAILTSVGGLLYPRLRRVESELSDAVEG